jgi:hypothetical protein
MDRAIQVLAQGVPPSVPKSYRALADHSNVPRSTLHHRARGRRSVEEKAQSQCTDLDRGSIHDEDSLSFRRVHPGLLAGCAHVPICNVFYLVETGRMTIYQNKTQ